MPLERFSARQECTSRLAYGQLAVNWGGRDPESRIDVRIDVQRGHGSRRKIATEAEVIAKGDRVVRTKRVFPEGALVSASDNESASPCAGQACRRRGILD
jgi:hypothetical protein